MTDNKDGWIEWSGGKCPVPAGTLVDTKADCGRIERYTEAQDVPWDSWISLGVSAVGDGCDVVAYRLAQPLTYQHEDGKPAADMEEF